MSFLLNPKKPQRKTIGLTLVLILLFLVLPAMSGSPAGNTPATADLVGSVADPQGAAVVDASVALLPLALGAALVTTTDQQGRFEFHGVLPGSYRLSAQTLGFASASAVVTVVAGQANHADLHFLQLVTKNQQVSVIDSDPAALTPDPSERILVHDKVLEANPG